MQLTKQLVLDFLKTQHLMNIATYGDHPWIASVYYSFDKDLNLYFLSAPRTLHCLQIKQNSQVSISIADSSQKPNQQKKGLQIFGIAKPISNKLKIKHALRLWKDALNIKDPDLTYQNIYKNPSEGQMHQVIPQKIKFFNQELFPAKDGQEPILEL